MIEPPGKGSWKIDLMHFPRPVTPLAAQIYRTAFAEGFQRGAARAGLLVDHIACEAVDGWMYNQPAMVGTRRGAAAPSRAVIFVASRLHPAIRRRARAAQRVLAEQLWRDDITRWNTEVKPARIRTHRELLASDVRALDAASLVEHVARCIATFEDSARSHGEFTIPALLPAGDLIAHAVEWTGEAPGQIVALLASSTPISAGDEPAHAALLGALRGTPDAIRALELPDPGQALDALVARNDQVGAAARDYVEMVGSRALTGYDVSEPTGIEIPFVLVEGLRAAIAGRLRGEGAGADQLGGLRDRIPAAHQEHFDRLLALARLASPIRDERVLFNDQWSAGVTRRALLEVGRRAVTRGLLPSADHAIAMLHGDPAALLLRGEWAVADAIIARFDARQRAMSRDMPPHLGPPPAPPLPVTWLPPRLRRVYAATLAAWSTVLDDAPSPAGERDRVCGIGASPGRYVGPARIIRGAEDFHRLRPGDVLVATTTLPSFNVVLPLLGAIVTDRGGALSHAAIIAREFGIPGVVGCREATARIRDGTHVRVDGAAGCCELLA